MKSQIMFMLALLLFSCINQRHSQGVVLNVFQLAVWYPSYESSTSLDLSTRRIVYVDHNTFSGLTSLEILRLNNNGITNIDSATFDDSTI